MVPIIRRVDCVGTMKLVDMANSANLYLADRQGSLYERAIQSPVYHDMVLEPLEVAEEILPYLWLELTGSGPKHIALIDCGPGIPRWGRSHIDLMTTVAHVSRYIVIDVNGELLSKVVAAAKTEGIDVAKVEERFENVGRPDLRIPDGCEALFLLGSTVMNYEEEAIKSMLGSLAKDGDYVATQIQLRSTESECIDLSRYQSEEIAEFTFGPLELMGDKRSDFTSAFSCERGRIEFRFIARDHVHLGHPRCESLAPGDVVLTGFSRRPSLVEHQSALAMWFRRFVVRVSRSNVSTSIGVI